MTQQIIDLDVISSGESTAAGDILAEPIGFSHGRQSLDRSVWYNGSLMTFLATAEETQGKFALIEAVSRKGNDPPPHIHRREDEIFYVLEGSVVVSVGDRAGSQVFMYALEEKDYLLGVPEAVAWVFGDESQNEVALKAG